ncbi:MAG: putative domain containing protein [Actinomycetia bacterium]|nr:putative domain containing protein [Actinomycetes bacterium]
MSTSFIEPGTRLARRYRLEERVHQSGGSSLWKATDEILARAVAVRTFEPDFPLIAKVVMAARSASRLTDPRLTQVFDADDSGELAYVVSEWVVGETLENMISTGGPMEPGRAATLLGEASEAIAAAHTSGLAHLRLTPRDLLWTTGNTVKILGLGVDAALTGTTVDSPALTDTQGLAQMLYLALTAYWPGTATCKLPAAPMNDGVPYAPHQLRAGVPQALDRITCRSLGISSQEPPLTSPAQLAEALSGVPRIPLPLFAGYPQGPPPSVAQRPAPPSSQRTRAMPMPAPAPLPAPPVRPQPTPSYDSGYGAGDSGYGAVSEIGPSGTGTGKIGKRPLIGVAAGLAALVIGIVGWQLAQGHDSQAKKVGPTVSVAPTTPKKSDVKLTVQSASGLDDPRPGHGDTSVGKGASAVFDGHPSTIWSSQSYSSADFGNYEKGLGVLLDMGKSVKVSRVKVVLAGRGGATLELRLGDGRTPGSLRIADKRTDASGTVELRNDKETAGQYVLLWFDTPAPAGFKAQIRDVTVYGQAS